jgi:hypothetical protein
MWLVSRNDSKESSNDTRRGHGSAKPVDELEEEEGDSVCLSLNVQVLGNPSIERCL